MKVGVLAIAMAILLPLAAYAGPAPDMDSDGTVDVQDICKLNPNSPSPNGCDTDSDGYGNACDGDYDNNGTVDIFDFGTFGASFGATGAPCFSATDMDGNGTVDIFDFGTFGGGFGGPPGPSGLDCAGTITCP
jgi:hypothetical protein